MAALFEALLPRLNFGISPDMMPLCQISGIYPARARALFDGGLMTVEDVACASLPKVEGLLRRLYQFESLRRDEEAARQQEQVIRQAARRIVRGAQELLGAKAREVEDEADEERRKLGSWNGGMH